MEKTPPPPSSVGHPLPLGEGYHFSSALKLGKPPSPLGAGLSFLVRVEVGKTALSLGERVARCRRFHQPVSRRGPVRGFTREGLEPHREAILRLSVLFLRGFGRSDSNLTGGTEQRPSICEFGIIVGEHAVCVARV